LPSLIKRSLNLFFRHCSTPPLSLSCTICTTLLPRAKDVWCSTLQCLVIYK
jgi:hypothetical protein